MARISVVMPYWMRSNATRKTLASYRELYDPQEVEVVIVDDGSPNDPARALVGEYPNLRLVELPIKERALNPCVPINRGVEAATGDVIALTNPEVTHDGPALTELAGLLEEPLDYAVAPCWYVEGGCWHAHPDPKLASHPNMPLAAGHFLVAFSRELWRVTGGFDESYRGAYGWDDADWLARVREVGARILWGTCRVLHTRHEAVSNWTGLDANAGRFFQKWSARGI
jgi:glycosyltransferase involved in cell wall biosynthesis